MWPVKITSTAAAVPSTISANSGRSALAASSPVVRFAPSWYCATITSASPLAASPSESWAATRLTAATGSPKSMVSMPEGETMSAVSSVTAPMTPTVRPPTSNSAYSGSAGVWVPFW